MKKLFIVYVSMVLISFNTHTAFGYGLSSHDMVLSLSDQRDQVIQINNQLLSCEGSTDCLKQVIDSSNTLLIQTRNQNIESELRRISREAFNQWESILAPPTYENKTSSSQDQISSLSLSDQVIQINNQLLSCEGSTDCLKQVVDSSNTLLIQTRDQNIESELRRISREAFKQWESMLAHGVER